MVPLANQLVLEKYRLDEVIVSAGETINKLFIVYKGGCKTVRTVKTTRSIKPSVNSKIIDSLPNFQLKQSIK